MAGDRKIGVAGVVVGAAMLVIVIVVGIVVFRPGRKEPPAAPQLNTPIERAANVKCVAQLNRVNAAIQMYAVENGKYPDRLEDLTVLSASDLNCPVANRVYNYDPATGRAWCPGHE